MHTHQTPDRSESHGLLRIVVFDGPQAAIPGRPRIVLSRRTGVCDERRRMALRDSGLLEHRGLPLPASPRLRILRAESDDGLAAGVAEGPAAILAMDRGMPRRAPGVVRRVVDPEGAA